MLIRMQMMLRLIAKTISDLCPKNMGHCIPTNVIYLQLLLHRQMNMLKFCLDFVHECIAK